MEMEFNRVRSIPEPNPYKYVPTFVNRRKSKLNLDNILLSTILFCLYWFIWFLVDRDNIARIIVDFGTIIANVRRTMDSVIDAYLGQMDGTILTEPDDIPKTNEPVWILAKRYNAIQELDLIRRDIQSRIWCTYRRGFVPIGTPQLTTDKGWGCMLRCGQMVLAQSFVELHLGREWFWTPETRDPTYLKIVNRFEDTRKSPFSIHQIALMGDSEDKKVGEWFGPNTVAQVLKKLVKYDDWCSISIHVALDNTVIIEEILNLCIDDDEWKPLLLIVPVRLGLNEINPIYVDGLKKCFEVPGNVGIIGGRPNQALYFIGYVGAEVIFLDPHTTQRSGTIGCKTTPIEMELDETFHKKNAARMLFNQMDPSLALCFLSRTRQEFNELCDRLQYEFTTQDIQPLFEIVKTTPIPWIEHTVRSTEEPVSIGCLDEFETIEPGSDEEFEFIA